MDAVNIYQVFDWLWSSGQLSETDIRQLPGFGVVAVINLALPSSSNALPKEAELVTEQGITYIHIPVEWEAPRVEQFVEFVRVMKAYEGQKLWVHCAKNMRVSAFLYLFRKLVLCESEEKAEFPMVQVWRPNEVWKGFIEQVERQHSHQSFKPFVNVYPDA
ncbi:MAG: protein tyrosine phosphatase family protein [Gammaproteobacteria bacterium]|nr:protein tyrosine phosphatase family protein [Gammaproteobacteria bacterium]